MKRFQRVLTAGVFLTISLAFGAVSAFAVILPGPADINRISPEQSRTPPASNGQAITFPSSPVTGTPAPANAKKIHFILRGFTFENVTVFTPEQLKALYEPYIGKKVTLDIAWQIADALTDKYREEGYFLSRAYVPAQEASKGILKINALEGSVGEVTLAGEAVRNSTVINNVIEALKTEKPSRLQTLERQLLLLKDLPGLSFQATLAPTKKEGDAEVHLILTATKTNGTTTLTINNNGSRYIGPHEVSAAWSGSLLPLQQTDLSIISAPSLSSRDGKFFTLNGTQKIMLNTTAMLDLTIGYSNAVPGYTLKVDDIVSQANNGGIGLSYRLIRQRQKNLSTRLALDFRDSDTNILQSVLSRDRVRAVQWGINYDTDDSLSGHNYLDIELRRGLSIFNSSSATDKALSRPGVHTDFTKAQLNYTRLQTLSQNWSSSLVITGQKASGTLYSSEEFGFGGAALGRAYDASEISGDDGLSGSVELHYLALPQWHQAAFIPYAFYDIGKVWNLYSSPGQPTRISGASTGAGINLQSAYGFSGNFYVAEPLTKSVATPLYGGSGKSPRYSFQLTEKC